MSGRKRGDRPGASGKGTSQRPRNPSHPPIDESDRTVFAPGDESTPDSTSGPPRPRKPRATPATPRPARRPDADPLRSASEAGESFTPLSGGQGIKVGDILNNTYQVKQFIARGGMGEVFEGVNLHTEERVAIKVMLPSLATEEQVITMFRREARTLTRLQHEALVQYRVLTQEPRLGVLYIVTDYIDGMSLADAAGKLNPTPAQLVVLLRRLAQGLRSAHALGAIHRDMSPDNVLLEGGKLENAKIIDFGIAKDVTPGSATVIGLGFAGKLEYVAPEQLGDFGGEVGPAADVYSLGLVMLAAAAGRGPRMGGTIADAIDKRRKGPDLSPAPAMLRPVLEKMLQADPARRLPTMDAVLAELDKLGTERRARIVPMVAAGGAGAVLLVLLAWWLLIRPPVVRTPTPAASKPASPAPATPRADPIDAARNAVNASLPSIACTWLDIVDVGSSEARTVARLVGVASDPAAAQDQLSRALAARGLRNTELDFEDVGAVSPRTCIALDAYRQVRSTDPPRLTSSQRRFFMRLQPEDARYANQMAANLVAEATIADPSLEVAVVAFDAPGGAKLLLDGRADLARRVARSKGSLQDLGGDRYRFRLDADNQGWIGLLLVTARSAMDRQLLAPPGGFGDPAWRDRFVATATNEHWRTDMLWIEAAAPPQ